MPTLRKNYFLFLSIVLLIVVNHSAGLNENRRLLKTSGTQKSRQSRTVDVEVKQIVSQLSLKWLDNGAIKIVWPNRKEDVIRLATSKQFPDLEGQCIFEGRPANVRTTVFSAAVIGCIDSKETIVNLGVNNEVLELLLLRNGTTLQNIWIPKQHGRGCTCSNQTFNINGKIFGKCNHRNKKNEKFFCYIDKKLQPECCEENSKQSKNHCLSYSLCSEADAPQAVPFKETVQG